jgi:hypothetical protein
MGLSELAIFVGMAVIALGIVDIWLTGKVLSAGGKEQNILMKWLQDLMPWSWEPTKAFIHLGVAIAIMEIPGAVYSGIVFMCIYILVCAWNLRVLNRLT